MRIGELGEQTGVSTKTLRFYEAEGLLAEPDRTASGYRDYRSDATQRVNFIRQAQSAGLKLSQIAEVLTIRDSGRSPCSHVRGMVDARLTEVDARLTDLRHTRAELLKLADRLAELDPRSCDRYCLAITEPAERGERQPW